MTTTIIPIDLVGPTLDKLDTTMLHLQGMLAMTFGEAFDGMPRDRRDAYMRGCAALVDECIALSDCGVGLIIAVDTDFKTAMTA